MAVLTGLPVGELLELDHAELEDLSEFIKGREEFLAWRNDTELLAGIHELLDSINQRLQGGLKVVHVRKIDKVKVKPVPRPPWMKKDKKLLSPREFFNKMMQGR